MQLNLFSGLPCVPNWGIIKDNSRVFIKWAFEVRVALNRSFLAKIELQVRTVLFSKMDHVVASMLSLLHKPLSPLCMSWSPCQLAIMKFKFNSSTTHSLSLIQNPLQVQIQVNFVKFKGLRSTAAAAGKKRSAEWNANFLLSHPHYPELVLRYWYYIINHPARYVLGNSGSLVLLADARVVATMGRRQTKGRSHKKGHRLPAHPKVCSHK